MKLISSFTTVVLAGLLLLIPAAYASIQYRCPRGDVVSMDMVLHYSSDHNERYNRDEYPLIPTGENYTSTTFRNERDSMEIFHIDYLIQVYGDPPQYQLSQLSNGIWNVCSMEKSYRY
ncbi:putative candidate secreted effector protein [Blumeria hordei DH14]|uniref:Putative candidate secreted effector protein n=1 Tax=Blumeria graminis f. sp. hordei (strain DH14) TaxID=546991 RepID=N1J5R0_BLUG1|nr:putative candidate secreted effector protein [Blumeria hordei DH14]